MCIILLDRLQTLNPKFLIHASNVHKLFVAAMIVSIKYVDDCIHKNTYYSKISGIPLKEVNLLESEFLSMIQFQVYVEEETLHRYRTKIRGYF